MERPAERIPPMMVIPEIAFEPDMRGVWSSGGTLVIISNPRKMAKIKVVKVNIISIFSIF